MTKITHFDNIFTIIDNIFWRKKEFQNKKSSNFASNNQLFSIEA